MPAIASPTGCTPHRCLRTVRSPTANSSSAAATLARASAATGSHVPAPVGAACEPFAAAPGLRRSPRPRQVVRPTRRRRATVGAARRSRRVVHCRDRCAASPDASSAQPEPQPGRPRQSVRLRSADPDAQRAGARARTVRVSGPRGRRPRPSPPTAPPRVRRSRCARWRSAGRRRAARARPPTTRRACGRARRRHCRGTVRRRRDPRKQPHPAPAPGEDTHDSQQGQRRASRLKLGHHPCHQHPTNPTLPRAHPRRGPRRLRTAAAQPRVPRAGGPPLVYQAVDLGERPGAANPGAKVMTLVSSMALGADCIDDCDLLRAGRTGQVLGHDVLAPSTVRTFPREQRAGHTSPHSRRQR
jgi:hypothetical protein